MDIKKYTRRDIYNNSSLSDEVTWVKDSDHLQVVKELEDKIESMKCCGNCKPLDIFDCEECKYIGNGSLDNWIPKESHK